MDEETPQRPEQQENASEETTGGCDEAESWQALGQFEMERGRKN
jgi:hypothetical protein